MRQLCENEVLSVSGGEITETHELYFNVPGKELIGVSLEIDGWDKELKSAGNIFYRCYNFIFSFANIFLNRPTGYDCYPIYNVNPIYS